MASSEASPPGTVDTSQFSSPCPDPAAESAAPEPASSALPVCPLSVSLPAWIWLTMWTALSIGIANPMFAPLGMLKLKRPPFPIRVKR